MQKNIYLILIFYQISQKFTSLLLFYSVKKTQTKKWQIQCNTSLKISFYLTLMFDTLIVVKKIAKLHFQG